MTAVRTLGVEEELMLFDVSGRTAVPAGADVVDPPGHRGDSEVEHEFKLEQAEIATPPCTDAAELEAGLLAARAELVERADARGVLVAALGTSPVRARPTPTDDERYARMGRLYGAVAEQQLAGGMHVHVGVDSRDLGVAVIDRLGPWLPVLVAMSSNSPYWQGNDTSYASYRTISWHAWPTAGPTEPFGDLATYDADVEALIESGAAMDPAMIYFDARLSATYPTVEVRVCDVAPTTDDALLLALLIRALVETAAREAQDGRPPALTRASLRQAGIWRAARFGLTGQLSDSNGRGLLTAADAVTALIAHTASALEAAGDRERVEALAAGLLRRGTGSELQRAAGNPAAAVRQGADWTRERGAFALA